MNLIIFFVVAAIVVIGGYSLWTYISVTKGTPVKNPFDNKPTAAETIVRSKIYPDLLYVGKSSKLDPTLRVMFPNALIAFPTDILTVKEFRYFEIDGNEFEEVIFEKQDRKEYTMLIDTYEHKIYFLNRVMSQQVEDGIIPPMGCQESIVLDENDTEYEYIDMSGLIEVNVSQEGRQSIKRQIRVYEREVTPEDNEFLVCMREKPTVCDYYIGFHIETVQLEDL